MYICCTKSIVFLNTILKVWLTKEAICKLEFIKIKNVKRMKKQAKDWEKTFGKGISNKGLLFKMYKKLFKHNNTETILKWPKTLTDTSDRRYTDGK